MRWTKGVALAALALAPVGAWAQPYAFVTSAAGNSIAVVDVAEDVLVSSIPMDGLPSGAMLYGGYLFVARTEANSLAKIDLLNGNTTMIPAGNTPVGVAANPFNVFVTNPGDDTVSVINAWSGNPGVILTKQVGDAPLAVVGGFPMLYVANWGDGTVTVIDTFTSGMPVVGTIPVGSFPAGLLQDFVGGRLYVANFLDDTVTVVDTATLSVTATIPVCARPRGLAGAAGHVYVACFDDGRIDMIDPLTNQVVLGAPSGGTNPLDLRADPSGQRLYVVHMQEGKSITVLDVATLVPLTAIDAPPGPVALAGFGTVAPPLGPGLRGVTRKTAGASHEWWSHRPAPRIPSLQRRPRTPKDVMIQDGNFDPNDWRILNATGGQETTQETVGGSDPPPPGGAWRRTVHYDQGSADHKYAAVSYAPASQGAVGTIDVSWDRRVETGGPAAERFVLFQGISTFRTVVEEFFSGGVWANASRLGLTAADFDDGSGGTPDFGASGAPIRFGYQRSNPTLLTLAHGIDNFTVTVHPIINGPGQLSIRRNSFGTVVVEDGSTLQVTVDRLGGTQGAVSATVAPLIPPFDTCSYVPPAATASWVNGDGSPRVLSIRVDCQQPYIVTRALALGNPTGGATIGNQFLVVEVWPGGLLLALLALLSGFSPLWLVALASPAALLAGRRRRSGFQARVELGPRDKAAGSPAGEP